MPKPPFRRKSAHGPESLLRYLFPQTRARARARLSDFRHKTAPSLKQQAQSRIYKYILYRQASRLKAQPSILQRLRGHSRRLLGSSHLENDARRRRSHLAEEAGSSTEPSKSTMSSQDGSGEREGGSRRRKLAGYLKAANELRQSYTQQYAPNFSSKEPTYEYEDDTPGSFPDAAVVRSGDEDMILFPSYARRHIKKKPEAQPGTIQEVDGEGRDVRDTVGAGDAEFWKQQWDNYEDDNAIVDVDVRGWIYSPHKGQMSRKQRLFIGLARQLVGISAPPAAATASNSAASSRDPSPGHVGFRERHEIRQAQRDAEMQVKEAEEILRRGQKEAELAARGAYSEKPGRGDRDDVSLYRTESSNSVRTLGTLSHMPSNSSLREEANITPLKKRASWNQPSDMNPSELAEANARLMARLRHFLAIPMANSPISVFFYNEDISKQRTVYTNASGHFSVSAALDFVPTHVRILASEQLSATEEVIVTESQGISVISDIDDTIKHSAISSGAREIFRNAFIRELGDLTIDGVKEWYNDMSKMGVKFHYVSNSPWQLFPVISKYFALAGLPPGSFHLKQYSGMMQGIFEPVAERKKVTLDKIARDFPERSFILIGDSGEADLEVYTDFVLENPGRVVAVFIRDVTTSETGGFFDPSVGPGSADRSSSSSPRGGTAAATSRAQTPHEDDDPEFKAAITASLQELEADDLRRSKSMFPQIDRDHPDLRPALPVRKPSSQVASQHSSQKSTPNLIDLSADNEPERPYVLRRANTDTTAETEKRRGSTASTKPAPPRPNKPVALRSDSGDRASATPSTPTSSKAPPPPKPRRSSTTIKQPSPLSQETTASPITSKPPVASKPNFNTQSQSEPDSQQSYAGMAREKLWSVYGNLPSVSSQQQSTKAPSTTHTGTNAADSKKAPPPPPPRRGVAAAAGFVGNKASSAWQHAPSVPHPSLPSRPHLTSSQTQQPFSTSTAQQKLTRTNTSSTLGMNGTEGQYVNKREQMWRQRWARAEEIMADKGVVLRSWRVGSDAVAETEQIIREYEKRNKGNGEKLGDTNKHGNDDSKQSKNQKTGGNGNGNGSSSGRNGGTSSL